MSGRARIAVGLLLPLLLVVPTIPLLSRLQGTLLGLPIGIVWLFGCIPVTSACLAACWYLGDRHRDEP